MAQVSAQKCLLCDEHDEQIGAYYCYECQQSLCTACRNRHGKIPALSGHTVADINTVDLSTVNKKSHCLEHEKEFLFFCVKCDTFICSKCVTSTHNTHPFSEIIEIVVKERQKAKENIEELKLKIDAISTLQEKVKTTHFEQLHAKSKQCIEHIESVSKDLQSCIESKKSIKATEVEDNEKNEQENLKAFVDNTDSVHKQYTQILSELENVLLEKHDVTFYSSYKSIDSDIQTLVSIPEEPSEAQVPIFEDKLLYQEVLEYMESEIGNSICQNCTVQKIKIEDLLSENKQCQETHRRALETKDKELKKFSVDIKFLKEEKQVMQSEYKRLEVQKDLNIRGLSDIIAKYKKLCQNCSVQKMKIEDLQSEITKCKELQRDLEKKDDELGKLSNDMLSLELDKLNMQSKYTNLKNSTYQKDAENKKLADKIKTLNKDLEKKNDEIKKMSRAIHSAREGGQSVPTNAQLPMFNCRCRRVYATREDLVNHKTRSGCM